RVAFIGLDRFCAVKERGTPLIRVAADEAVEIVEAETSRPEIKRSCLAGLPVGNVVVLAVPGACVRVLAENLGHRAVALGHERFVAGVAGAEPRDHAGLHGMMIAAGDESGAGGRAESGRVEIRVAQPRGSNTVVSGCRDRPAERARGAEAD